MVDVVEVVEVTGGVGGAGGAGVCAEAMLAVNSMTPKKVKLVRLRLMVFIYILSYYAVIDGDCWVELTRLYLMIGPVIRIFIRFLIGLWRRLLVRC